MNTANDYARHAIELESIRQQVKRDAGGPYEQKKREFEWALIHAARLARVIADTIGERATAAGV